MALRGLIVVVVLASTGCDGRSRYTGDGPTATPWASPPPSPPALSTDGWHGHLSGHVDGLGDADGLLTSDGLMRLRLADNGPPDHDVPENQLVAHLDFDIDENRAFGTGVIIGQLCATPSRSVFCDEPGHAEISLTATTGNSAQRDFEVTGELRVTTSRGDETWPLTLGYTEGSWKTGPSEGRGYGYDGPASLDSTAGVFREDHAEFGDVDDTVINIDRAGRLFFQSPNSGCVGNGALAPHLDGRYNVYDVELTIENCGATHAHLNGKFEGLASHDSYDYMSIWLIMWLSTTDDAPSRAALNLWGAPIY